MPGGSSLWRRCAMSESADAKSIDGQRTATDGVRLKAQDLHKSYALGKRALEVLRGVNLSVSGGEFLALRGASGAGKSTLLHLLGGLDTPNAGSIWFAGEDLAHLSARELA